MVYFIAMSSVALLLAPFFFGWILAVGAMCSALLAPFVSPALYCMKEKSTYLRADYCPYPGNRAHKANRPKRAA